MAYDPDHVLNPSNLPNGGILTFKPTRDLLPEWVHPMGWVDGQTYLSLEQVDGDINLVVHDEADRWDEKTVDRDLVEEPELADELAAKLREAGCLVGYRRYWHPELQAIALAQPIATLIGDGSISGRYAIALLARFRWMYELAMTSKWEIESLFQEHEVLQVNRGVRMVEEAHSRRARAINGDPRQLFAKYRFQRIFHT